MLKRPISKKSSDKWKMKSITSLSQRRASTIFDIQHFIEPKPHDKEIT